MEFTYICGSIVHHITYYGKKQYFYWICHGTFEVGYTPFYL